MGQYYTPIILNGTGGKVIGSFSPYDYQNGMKLMEHSYIGNQLVDSVVAKALYVSVSTGKTVTLAWVGDYATLEEDIRTGYYTGQNRDYERIFNRAQRAADNEVDRIPPDDEEIKKAFKNVNNVVFYNNIRKEKLSLQDYRKAQIANRLANGLPPYRDDPEDFIIHPIPLLTALGNGKGGGDYSGSCMEWIGKWALHPLWIVPEGVSDPEGEWTDISNQILFEENRG